MKTSPPTHRFPWLRVIVDLTILHGSQTFAHVTAPSPVADVESIAEPFAGAGAASR